MKFEEILPALRAGKKISRNNWCKDDYIYINSNGEFEDQNGHHPGIFLNCLCDLEADEWKIVKEPKKVKLRDLTKKQYQKWQKTNCKKSGQDCSGCPFQKVQCYNDDRVNNIWYLNKGLYSDEFLDQEIEIKED